MNARMAIGQISARISQIESTIAQIEGLTPGSNTQGDGGRFSRALDRRVAEYGKANSVRQPTAEEIAAALLAGPINQNGQTGGTKGLETLQSLLNAGSIPGTLPGAPGAVSPVVGSGPLRPEVAGLPGTTPAGEAIVKMASLHLGKDYVWGGESDAEGGYDCSGLVQDAFKRLGIKMPRVARDQQHIGVRVNSLAEAKPGDLLTFGNPAHHIGIYAGNGEWIEAPRTGLKVRRHKLTRKVTDIRRVIPDGATIGQIQPQSAKRGAYVSINTATPPVAPPSPMPTAGQGGAARPIGGVVPGTPVTASTSGQVRGNMVITQSGPAPIMQNHTQRSDVPVGPNAVGATPASVKVFNATQAAAARSNDPEYKAALNPYDTVSNVPYAELFNKAGRMYGISPRMLAAIAKTESNFRPHLTSRAGAVGVMQLMPVTAREVGVPLEKRTDPVFNIDGASHYIAKYFAMQPNVSVGLAAFNAGPGAVRRAGGVPNYTETKNYVRKVREYMHGIS
ncbi:transglycosylase SLT domain-containing protein [Stomatohabitans albus]|uniref:transglycosylase SLT domain-containing protein n=1 Tax=Stomatohabitans albus TaxID=3110766 RepID=UPI00300D271D